MKLGVAILAAGASSRMGRAKLLLPWEGTSVLGNLLEQWRALEPAQLAVVARETDAALRGELERLKVLVANRIINPVPERGMFSSVQCAARWEGWTAGLTHWAVALGDQPLVRRETLRELLGFASAHPQQVCQPSRNGRGRHPVILPRTIWERLRDASAENLKQFLLSSGASAARWETGDEGLDLDLDEPEDYARALERLRKEAACAGAEQSGRCQASMERP